MASTARRSAAPAAAKAPPNATSCWKARWITPSESSAAFARPSRVVEVATLDDGASRL